MGTQKCCLPLPAPVLAPLLSLPESWPYYLLPNFFFPSFVCVPFLAPLRFTQTSQVQPLPLYQPAVELMTVQAAPENSRAQLQGNPKKPGDRVLS